MKDGIKKWLLVIFLLGTGIATILYIRYFKIDTSSLFLLSIIAILNFLLLVAILELWRFVEVLENRISKLEGTAKK